jgi:hypothetical protein
MREDKMRRRYMAHPLYGPPTKVKRMRRHYILAAVVAVLVAVAAVTPAFAAKAVLSPTPHHVNCPAYAISAGSTACNGIAVFNDSGSTITLTGLSWTGKNISDFAGTTSSCTGSLDSTKYCLIYTNFNPSATGHRSATVTVSESTSGTSTSISLAGTGT